MKISRSEIRHTYLLFRAFVNFCLDKNLSRHAKALSFSTVLALIPTLIVFFGSLATTHWMTMAQEKVQSLLINNLFPRQIGDIFSTYITQIISVSSDLKIIGFLLLCITVIFLFMDIEDSFDDITTVGNKKHWYLRILSIGSLFLIPVCVFLLIALAQWLLSISPSVLQDMGHWILGYGNTIKSILFVLLWAWFYFLYRALPEKKINRYYLAASSLFAASIFVLAQLLFGWYLSSFSSYDLIYGVLAAIPVFLLWIYLNWQITLYPLAFAFFYQKYVEKEAIENKKTK